jgi:hypothetical protein
VIELESQAKCHNGSDVKIIVRETKVEQDAMLVKEIKRRLRVLFDVKAFRSDCFWSRHQQQVIKASLQYQLSKDSRSLH